MGLFFPTTSLKNQAARIDELAGSNKPATILFRNMCHRAVNEILKNSEVMSSDSTICIAKGSFYNEDLCFFLTGGQHYYFSQQFVGSHLTRLKHGFGTISVLVKTKLDSCPMMAVK